MKFGATFVLLSFFSVATLAQKPAEDHAASAGAGTTVGGIADLAAGRRKIRIMRDKADAARAKRAKAIADELLEGADNGKLTKKLSDILIGWDIELSDGGEAFTDKEENEVFGELLKELNPADGQKITEEYTQARRELRKALLEAVKQELMKSKDFRAVALVKVIEQIKPKVDEAYRRALQKISEEKITRPICFSCGDQINPDSLSAKADDYDYQGKMPEIAKAALLEAGLDNESGEGVFFNGKFARLSNGKIVTLEYSPGGVLSAKTSPDTKPVEQRRLGEDLPLNELIRNFYLGEVDKANVDASGKPLPGPRVWPKAWTPSTVNWVDKFIKNTDPANPIMKLRAKALASAAPEKGAEKILSRTNSVAAFVEAMKKAEPDESTLAALYPYPEQLASAVGLVQRDGTDIVEWKGEGQHWAPGSAEFGVKVKWDVIDRLLASKNPEDRAEANRLLGIMKEIRDGSIKNYKVVNGKSGHCLWCNLNNDSAAVKHLKAYEAGLKAKVK